GRRSHGCPWSLISRISTAFTGWGRPPAWPPACPARGARAFGAWAGRRPTPPSPRAEPLQQRHVHLRFNRPAVEVQPARRLFVASRAAVDDGDVSRLELAGRQTGAA